MEWLYDVAYFIGGAALINVFPHLISGLQGRPFRTPFSRPRRRGLSSSTTNVLWGFFNLLLAYLLLCRVGNFDLRATDQVIAAGLGALLLGLVLSRTFRRFDATTSGDQSETPPQSAG